MKKILKRILIVLGIILSLLVISVGGFMMYNYFSRKPEENIILNKPIQYGTSTEFLQDNNFLVDNKEVVIDLLDTYYIKNIHVETDNEIKISLISGDREKTEIIDSGVITIDLYDIEANKIVFSSDTRVNVENLEVVVGNEIGPKRTKDTNVLRVASFNLAAGKLPNLGTLNKEIIREDIDIIGMQEVDMFMYRNPEDMLARVTNGYGYRYFDTTLQILWMKYGLGIASSIEPSEVIATPLITQENEEDRIYQKAIFSVNNKPLVLYNTHLSFESQESRKQQLEDIKKDIILNSYEYVVFMGDLNLDNVEELNIFEGILVNTAGKDGVWKDTFNGEVLENNVIDHIMVSKNIKVEEFRVGSRKTSDHNIIIADLIIE